MDGWVVDERTDANQLAGYLAICILIQSTMILQLFMCDQEFLISNPE